MSDLERVRPLAEITSPDPRHTGQGEVPEALYKSLSELHLNEAVPVDVRQLYETAKNLSLYSWFVYRFHPIASFIGYSCLEAALKPLAMRDPSFPKQSWPGSSPSFKRMMEHAVASGWIRNEGFENARLVAQARARQRTMIEQIDYMSANGIDEMPSREPTADQIEAELRSLPYAKDLVDALPALRNVVAHGRPFLYGGSVGTLRVVAEAINQLFPVASSADEKRIPEM